MNSIQNIKAITAWNRLEPRPRTKEFNRSIRAEVRDALWMLTRQWQMDEFKAEDNASPASAEIELTCVGIEQFKPGQEQSFRSYDKSVPLEAQVESESTPVDLGLRVQMGHHWLKMLRKTGLASFSTDFISSYPISNDSGSDTRTLSNKILQSYRQTISGRSLDGWNFYNALSINNNRALEIIQASAYYPTFTSTQAESDFQQEINTLSQQFKSWFNRMYKISASEAWSPAQLEYNFSLTSDIQNGARTVLSADAYHNGRLEWHSFDKEPDIASTSSQPIDHTVTERFVPVQIQFPGIPGGRWWEFEDSKINFSQISANPTDISRLLYLEFIFIFKNDWFVVPYSVTAGNICQVKNLIVTDVFGLKHRIKGTSEVLGDWGMYSLNTKEPDTIDPSRLLFIPDVVAKPLEGKPFEQVDFIRDEMANIVWGVEKVIPDGLGGGMNAFEAAQQHTTYLKENLMPEQTASDILNFKLATQVPDNWIPFVPVQVADSLRKIKLQRAAMPIQPVGTGLMSVTEPRSYLLSKEEHPSPYYINEEEVTGTGTIVTRAFQRTRWYQGKTFLWNGYQKRVGRGERNSGLLFDQIS